MPLYDRLLALPAGLALALMSLSPVSPPKLATSLGVQCGSGVPGSPGVILVRVSTPTTTTSHRLQVATEPTPSGQDRPSTELEVHAAGRSATCRATDPSPFLVEATDIAFRTAQLLARSTDSLRVEVRGPDTRLLASAHLYPPGHDAVTLSW